MTILKGEISEKINQKFRKLAMERFGYEKGSISKAIEEAILQWILDQKAGNTNIEEMRLKNNETFQNSKKRLFMEYPNRYVTICDGKIAEVGDDYFSTLEKTKEKYPDSIHCLIIKTSLPTRRKARLGWRIKRTLTK
jgi:hypothetical protein